jgi:hypothetical protein
MKKLILAMLATAALMCLWPTPAFAQRYNSYQLQFVDWEGRPVNLGTSISITFYKAGTTDALTIYKDSAGNYTCTSPITEDSTNTPLLYTVGLLTFYTNARSFKMTVTDATYTQTYDNVNTSGSVRWPPPGVADSGTSLGQTNDVDFAYAGFIFDGDTAGQIELIPDADGGIWKIGDATYQTDIYWYTGDGTDYVFADEGNAIVNFVDIDALFDDDAIAYFGTHKDFSIKSNSTTVLNILPLTTDETSTINFGANLQGVDLKLFSATTGTYILFDASDDSLKFVHDDIKLDDNSLLYAGSDLDFSVKSSTAKNLDILPVTTDESSIVNLGADTAGVDLKAFGATTGEYLLWDASADTLFVNSGNSSFTQTDAEANQFKVDATGTVAGNAVVFETTNGGVQFNVDGAANGDLDIDADSTIDVNALDDITITVASGSAGEDLSLTVSGATDSSILLTSAGTGADAIGLAAAAGTVKISGNFLDVDTTEDLDIKVTSSTDGEDLLVTQVGANDSHITLTAAGTSADAIGLVTTGGGITTTSAGTYTATAVGAVGLFSNAVAQTVTLGNETGASSLAFKAGTGNITMDGVAATTITIGDAAQTGTMKFGESSANSEVDIGTGTGVRALNVGTGGTGAKTIAIGDGASTGSITLYSGSGDVILKSTDNIEIGTDAVAQDINIGNETGATSLVLHAGTGNIAIDGVAATTVTIGDAAQTGTMKFGESSATVEVDLATGTGAHTVHVADGAGVQTVTVGSTNTTSGTTIQSGTGDIAITSTDDLNIGTNATAQDITIGNETAATSLTLHAGTGNIAIDGVAATTITVGDAAQTGTMKFGESSAAVEVDLATGTGAHTVHVADGAGAQTITVGSTNTTSATTIQSGTGDVAITSTDDLNIGTNATAQDITIGNETAASSLVLHAGTGNITIDGVAATTITVGDAAQTGIMKFGESSASVQVDLATGTGAHTVNLANGGGGTQVVDIGSTSSASSLSLFAGTGNIDMQGVAATTITIGKSDQTGTISMGTSTAGLTMNLATGNGAKVVNVATGTGIDQIVLGGGGTAADNIDIADEDTQANTIDIGGTASTTTITGTLTNTSGYVKSAVNVGAVVAGTCTAVEYSNNGFHRTVLTLLTGTTVTVSDGGDGTGIKIYDFPEGNVIVLGAFADALLTADAHMTGAYAASFGTVTAGADDALSSTEADFVASTAITQGSNKDFHGVSALTAAGLVMVPFDGTGGGKDVYFNAAAADANADAAAVVTAQSGTVVIEWIYLGDF